jgi:Magnesium-protoporphyrin IX methyltransferase C-terminus
VPIAERWLQRRLDEDAQLQGWSRGRTERVSSGFYTSQALELTRAAAPGRPEQGPTLPEGRSLYPASGESS